MKRYIAHIHTDTIFGREGIMIDINAKSEKEAIKKLNTEFNQPKIIKLVHIEENELFEKIRKWSIERELNTQSPNLQTLKLIEELGELSRALQKDDREEIKDALGDILVVLIILAQQLGLNLERQLADVYEIINKRKGKIVNGLFVKDV